MNTTSKILLTVGVLSAVGVGYYILTKNKPSVTQDQLAGLNANTVSKIDEPLDTPANTIVADTRSNPRQTVITRDVLTGATSTGTRGATLGTGNTSGVICGNGRRC